MLLPSGKYDIGPDNGTVNVRTYREGLAMKIGHDLVIGVGRWNGTITLDADTPANSSVSVTMEAGSLEVLSGTGGAKPLSDKDKKDILSNMQGKILHTDKHPQITFVSDNVEQNGPDRATVNGQLTVTGTTRPVRMELALEETGGAMRASGTISLKQTDFGIKPYTGLLGALKVKDVLEIDIEASVKA
jgi:polyisoprenoid-binding protein YceI